MIKHSPADFFVEELLNPEFLSSAKPELSAENPFALFLLAKESLATPEAASRIARELKLQAGAVAYAGLKDKHASTRQYVTVKCDASLAESLAGPGWSLKRVGYTARAVESADIVGNFFRITVRNLTEESAFDMQQAARLLSASENETGQLRIVNYFGDQRFGSARHGQGFLAKFLIKGDFETALKLAIATEARKDRMEQKHFKRTLLSHWGKWREVLPKLRNCPEKRPIERLANSGGDFRAAFCALPYLLQQLSVYAYQSHLWNSIAREFVSERCSARGQILLADDAFGEMLFPERAAIAPEIAELSIPLLARKTELIAPWRTSAEKVLAEEGIAVSELEIPGVRRPFFGEEPRSLFIVASDFKLGPAEIDDSATNNKRRKRVVSFALPRGSYATVLLRALGQ